MTLIGGFKMILFWLMFLFLHETKGNNDIYRASYCYGDSSANTNSVNISCPTGVIFIHDIIAARKPDSLGCPDQDHATTPAGPECCVYNSTDCLVSFSGEWGEFQAKCNFKTSCSGIPVIRDENECDRNVFKRFSNYMVIEYYCMAENQFFDPCNTVDDCSDPAAICNKNHCVCDDGYTIFYAFDDCWEDGKLNGSCTGPVGCQDAGTMCNFTSGRCVCDSHLIAHNGTCKEGGDVGGLCLNTEDCTDPNAACNNELCVCKDGYTKFDDSPDCWKDGGPNGSCSATIVCDDPNSSCNTLTNRCKCVNEYSLYEGTCYADGGLGGFCNTSVSCVDTKTECNLSTSRCECIEHFIAFNGHCHADGKLFGKCNDQALCSQNNTVCTRGKCECKSGLTSHNDECYQDGKLNGLCNDEAAGACTDINTQCSSDRCVCETDFSEFENVCYKDNTLNGHCSGSGSCIDANTECNVTSGRCSCIQTYSAHNDKCYKDGSLFGECTSTIACTETNSVCEVTNVAGRCVCDVGYSDYQDKCNADGDLHGACATNADCVLGQLVECVGGRCECIDDYSDINQECIQDGILGGACVIDDDCDDDDAFCNSSTPKVCVCNDGYTEILDTCEEDGGVGGVCNTDADCKDAKAECNQHTSVSGISVCLCVSEYTNVNETCMEDGSNGGICKTGGRCEDDNAECIQDTTNRCNGVNCDPGVCQCKSGYTIGSGGACIKDGALGGACMLDEDCDDDGADCSSSTPKVCVCKDGYTEILDTCEEDGGVGGVCNIDADCKDAKAECNQHASVSGISVCLCVSEYTNVNGTCMEDGSNGGICKTGGRCEDDNAECIHDTTNRCNGVNCDPGVCQCKSGYTVGSGGACIKDGLLGGLCDSQIVCSAANTVCNSATSTCECVVGSSEYNGGCFKDGSLNGECTASNTCTDANTDCDLTTARCVCVSGYSNYQDVCYADGELHGFCDTNTKCVDDPLAECVDNRCDCIEGYSDINMECIEDGILGGSCEVDIDCDDNNAVCDSSVPKVCVCTDGYTNIDGSCEEDGGVDGVCNNNADCKDANAECKQHNTVSGVKVCQCVSDYTNIDGTCMEENHLGGRCTGPGTCLENSTECSSVGICVCIADFTEVNDQCIEDGSNGGICKTGGRCEDDNAECVQDTAYRCNGVNCDPGVCQCKTGYTVGFNEVCIQDGALGGKCMRDNDCVDANANCDNTHVCVCSIGYSNYQSVCIEDGYPSGNCLTDDSCIESHSICINGKCVCNDVRNYVIKDGACLKDDGYVNGDCSQIPCNDPNAECVETRCSCKSGYVQTNGVCTQGGVSSVTSCDGSSPYNQLEPDCDEDSVSTITDSYERVKPAGSICTGVMDTYNEADFTRCCSPVQTDCRLDGSGDDACTPSQLSGSYTTYNVIEYICISDGTVIAIDEDSQVTGNVIYITQPATSTGVSDEVCSVQANCRTDVLVYGDYVNLNEENGNCGQYLTIDDVTFDCDNSSKLPFTVTLGFFFVSLSSPNKDGHFVLGVKASNINADVTVSCGDKRKTQGTDPTNTCENVVGSTVGETCIHDESCANNNAICQDEVCVCEKGFEERDATCHLIDEPTDGSSNDLINIVVPVVVAAVVLGGIVASVIFRKNIKRKLCPGKADEKKVVDPSPMNMKYKGGVPSAVVTPSLMPVPWKNTGWSPMNEKFKPRKSTDLLKSGTLPPIKSNIPATSGTTVSGSSQKPNLEKRMTIMDQLNKEQMESDKQYKDERSDARKKKRAKKMRKARVGIMAKGAFELPKKTMTNTQPGVFKPNENFYQHPKTTSSQSVPSLNQSLRRSVSGSIPDIHPLPVNMPAPHPPPNRLPPVRESTNFRSSVRSVVGIRSAVNSFQSFRRNSVLEISSVDDPTKVEQTVLGEFDN